MIGKKTLKIFFQLISLLGTLFFLIPAVIYFFGVNSALAVNLVYILIPTQLLCTAIKFIFPKSRPVPMPDKTIIQKYIAGSFPSIHTARITAFAIPIAQFYANKVFILAALFAIISVGYSRIYLKKHYFTDVLAGVIIGGFMSFLGIGIQNYLNLY